MRRNIIQENICKTDNLQQFKKKKLRENKL